MLKRFLQGFVRLFGTKVHDCKYGENPQQKGAALHRNRSWRFWRRDPLALHRFKILLGQPSYNNFTDLDRALQTMTHIAAGFAVNFEDRVPNIAIGIKHGNACGASFSFTMRGEALAKMAIGNSRALFGGLVMTNFPLNEESIDILLTSGLVGGQRRVLDSVVCPEISREALLMLHRKKEKCRVICNPALSQLGRDSIDREQRSRSVRGGKLVQDNYEYVLDFQDERVKRLGPSFDIDVKKDILFAWAIGCTSTSNTITVVKKRMLIGNGVGQQDRVTAARLALKLANEMRHDTSASVAYSDSFFPFEDAPLELIDAGVNTIFTSSGSMGDKKVIALCDERMVALCMVPDEVGRGFYGH